MSSIFSKYKDVLLDYVEDSDKYNLRFPLKKTGNIFNNYVKGDFIVVGGRKTSGKSSFILNNYVISPLVQRLESKKNGTPFDLKVIYMNTRKNMKMTMDRMIVNYVANRNKGNKIGVPSLYRYEGNHVKLSVDKAKSILSSTMNTFDKLVNAGILSVTGSNKSLYEIDDFIKRSLEEYGSFEEDTGEFIYDEEHKNLITIISIDDITGIIGESGKTNFKNDNSHQVAIRLKEIAKIYNVIIILGVPSSQVYSRSSGHRSTVEELAPYHIYADRSIILHNPIETDDKKMLGYETDDFVNPRSGISYLRTAYITSNYMGPSGLHFGYFMYPETGYMVELPPAEDMEEGNKFANIVLD